jgi:hypothetical protein
LIADFIKSGKSTIKIWYIAGNQLTNVGIEPITEALTHDNFVTALWYIIIINNKIKNFKSFKKCHFLQ